MDSFWMEFAFELVKYVALIALAVAGVFSGAKLRKLKDSKNNK